MIWLINSSLSFYPITSQHNFYNHKIKLCQGRTQGCCVFFQTQLQQITVQEHLFVKFAFALLTFGPCTYPTDTFPFTYHFPSVSITIIKPLNSSLICAVENFQRFQRQIIILDNPRWRRCSYFRFLYTLHSSGDFHWFRETEAHITLFIVRYLPV